MKLSRIRHLEQRAAKNSHSRGASSKLFISFSFLINCYEIKKPKNKEKDCSGFVNFTFEECVRFNEEERGLPEAANFSVGLVTKLYTKCTVPSSCRRLGHVGAARRIHRLADTPRVALNAKIFIHPKSRQKKHEKKILVGLSSS